MLTLDLIYKASTVLQDVVRKTQLIPTDKINPDCNIFLKPENLQVTGSFKVRGAGFKISQLTDEEKAHGVIACSAGNHAQGVALANGKVLIPTTYLRTEQCPFGGFPAWAGENVLRLFCRRVLQSYIFIFISCHLY